MTNIFTRFLSQELTTLAESMLLLENRIEFLKQNMEGKLDTSHDTHAKAKTTSDIVDHFATHADPTPNKAHTQWILKQYQNKSIRQEDAPRVHAALTGFNQVKSRLEKKDINQYQSVADVETAIHPHMQSKEEKATKTPGFDRRDPDAYGDDHIKKIYHDKESGVKAYHVKSKQASISCYGGGHGSPGGTSWCTAADSGNNMFDHYSNKSRLITMHFPNGRKLQLNHSSEQMMDEKDTSVDLKDPGYAPYKKQIAEVVDKTGGKSLNSLRMAYGTVSKEEADKYIEKNPQMAAENLPLNDEQFNKLSAPKTTSWGT